MFKFFIFIFLILNAFYSYAADIEADKVILRGVDKITGRINTMEVAVGEMIEFGKLQILVNKCLTKPIEEAPENAAFLTILKKKGKDKLQPVFNGWMFSSNPALSAMEDPVYDVWVISCSKTEPNFEDSSHYVKPVVADNQIVVMENLQENKSQQRNETFIQDNGLNETMPRPIFEGQNDIIIESLD